MTLLLKKEIYQRKSVLKAIDAYCSIATISFKENETDWICEFIKTEYDPTLTIQEFENYIISLEG